MFSELIVIMSLALSRLGSGMYFKAHRSTFVIILPIKTVSCLQLPSTEIQQIASRGAHKIHQVLYYKYSSSTISRNCVLLPKSTRAKENRLRLRCNNLHLLAGTNVRFIINTPTHHTPHSACMERPQNGSRERRGCFQRRQQQKQQRIVWSSAFANTCKEVIKPLFDLILYTHKHRKKSTRTFRLNIQTNDVKAR